MRPAPFLCAEVELTDQLIIIQRLRLSALELDLAMHDDIPTVGNTNSLRKVLFRHQHSELKAIL